MKKVMMTEHRTSPYLPVSPLLPSPTITMLSKSTSNTSSRNMVTLHVMVEKYRRDSREISLERHLIRERYLHVIVR